jgi:hypothetical protein
MYQTQPGTISYHLFVEVDFLILDVCLAKLFQVADIFVVGVGITPGKINTVVILFLKAKEKAKYDLLIFHLCIRQ